MPTLYDAYNRPVDFDALRMEQAAPEFIGVRNIYAVEHPEIALTPEKLAGILRQAEMGDPYFYFEVAEAMGGKGPSLLFRAAHAQSCCECARNQHPGRIDEQGGRLCGRPGARGADRRRV
ncbi:MAG: DUF935 family protein [Candidatus Binataceae bacterium]